MELQAGPPNLGTINSTGFFLVLMPLTIYLWHYFSFPEVRCLSYLQGNMTGPTQCHRAGITIRPDRVLGQWPVTVTCIPQAPLLHFCSAKAFLSSKVRPHQFDWHCHSKKLEASWCIANHCDCLTNNITDKTMRSTSYQTSVPFPFCFFPSGLSFVTKNTLCNSAADQEPL